MSTEVRRESNNIGMSNHSELDQINIAMTVLDAKESNFFDTLYAQDDTINLNEARIKNSKETEKIEQSEDEINRLSLSFGPSMFAEHYESNDSNGNSISRKRFEITNQLGSGAFGEVFGACDKDLNRSVALKQFKGESNHALAACHNELRFVGRLEHPSVPPVYQASMTNEGTPYIVMKKLEGESLQLIINKLQAGDARTHAHYSFYHRAELIIQLLRVVSNAHLSKVLHRDIKPENIIIGRSGELYLMDWGIAEDFEKAQKEPILCGTPYYMSPEQAQAKGLGPESDLYSIGVLAYELMSLKHPGPSAGNLRELIEILPKHRAKSVDQVFHASQGYVSSEFRLPIMTALEPQVDKRYHSATAMLADFEAALNGEFEVLCPRTRLKSMCIRLNKWLDRRLINVIILYASLLSGVILLIALGVLVGWLLNS